MLFFAVVRRVDEDKRQLAEVAAERGCDHASARAGNGDADGIARHVAFADCIARRVVLDRTGSERSTAVAIELNDGCRFDRSSVVV